MKLKTSAIPISLLLLGIGLVFAGVFFISPVSSISTPFAASSAWLCGVGQIPSSGACTGTNLVTNMPSSFSGVYLNPDEVGVSNQPIIYGTVILSVSGPNTIWVCPSSGQPLGQIGSANCIQVGKTPSGQNGMVYISPLVGLYNVGAVVAGIAFLAGALIVARRMN